MDNNKYIKIIYHSIIFGIILFCKAISQVDTSSDSAISNTHLIITFDIFSGRPDPFYWLDDVPLSDRKFVVEKIQNACNSGNISPPKASFSRFRGMSILLQTGQNAFVPIAHIQNKSIELNGSTYSSICNQKPSSNTSIAYHPDNNSELETKLVQLAFSKGIIDKKSLDKALELISKQ